MEDYCQISPSTIPHASTFGGSGDPHMWEVTQAVRNWWSRWGSPPRVCVGLSGGADSLALTAAAVLCGAQEVWALCVDHGLQEGSQQVAQQAAAIAGALGCTQTQVLPVTISRRGVSMEAAARDSRYQALAMAAQGAPVLLGHTLDDQAETLLLGLVRGSGPRAIAGMMPWSSPWGRPLLQVRRTTTRSACAEHQLPVWEDPHNSNSAYTRVRVRTELLPLLQEIAGGDCAPAISRTAQLVGEDTRILDEYGQQLYQELASQSRDQQDALTAHQGLPSLPAKGLEEMPSALRRRVIREWLLATLSAAPTSLTVSSAASSQQGSSWSPSHQLNYRQIETVERLITQWHGQGPVFLSGRWQVARTAGMLTLIPPAGTP